MSVHRFPVEEGAILLFARSIGDESPAYRFRPGEPIWAPPTFVQSAAHFDPHFKFRPHDGVRWHGSGGASTPSGSNGTSTDVERTLHAGQRFVYYRPIRSGDVLSSGSYEGKTWQKAGARGRLTFSEHVTEFRDAAGELVVTATSVAVTIDDGAKS